MKGEWSTDWQKFPIERKNRVIGEDGDYNFAYQSVDTVGYFFGPERMVYFEDMTDDAWKTY